MLYVVESFIILMEMYIYTGRLSLSSMKDELVLELLGLAHKYGFTDLEQSISEYLKAVLNVRNMCLVYGAAHLYSLRSLSEGFLQLSAAAVEQMVQRDSLCAPEIDLFKAVREWVRQHPDQVCL
ncbi:unnamed protein product [Gongylonema pulchrum]|uniref:BACK domain-containing protein n=1 Tax=Gongylonema pulchrum TaxID=637853 RepID=A0A183EQ39_9BILA|nr:unnamed protein product [Gongylonema pulchrum]